MFEPFDLKVAERILARYPRRDDACVDQVMRSTGKDRGIALRLIESVLQRRQRRSRGLVMTWTKRIQRLGPAASFLRAVPGWGLLVASARILWGSEEHESLGSAVQGRGWHRSRRYR